MNQEIDARDPVHPMPSPLNGVKLVVELYAITLIVTPGYARSANEYVVLGINTVLCDLAKFGTQQKMNIFLSALRMYRGEMMKASRSALFWAGKHENEEDAQLYAPFRKAFRGTNRRNYCSPTGMFALPNPISHVSNAAFTQARLRPGSSSALVCLGLLRSTYPCYTTWCS